MFIAGNVVLMILMIFETTIFSWIVEHLDCFSSIQKRFEEMDAISDDYFDIISFNFLISEYERTK